MGNDPEEREDLLAPEIPAPPEIKQVRPFWIVQHNNIWGEEASVHIFYMKSNIQMLQDEEEEEGEENGGLSKSGKELKKLLGKAAGLESDAEDEDDDDEVPFFPLSVCLSIC